MSEFKPNWVSPPCDTLLDIIEEKGFTPEQIVRTTGYSFKEVDDILANEHRLTMIDFHRLAYFTNTTIHFWYNREQDYVESL
ncbi:MAG: hypothetical protein R3321_02135 [Nitrososphaeraceae archaeon]|nr:hypothetical protein [Nitrososphaeraceae archaeon]